MQFVPGFSVSDQALDERSPCRCLRGYWIVLHYVALVVKDLVFPPDLSSSPSYSLPSPLPTLDLTCPTTEKFPFNFWGGILVGFCIWPILELLVLIKQWVTLSLRARIAKFGWQGRLYEVIGWLCLTHLWTDLPRTQDPNPWQVVSVLARRAFFLIAVSVARSAHQFVSRPWTVSCWYGRWGRQPQHWGLVGVRGYHRRWRGRFEHCLQLGLVSASRQGGQFWGCCDWFAGPKNPCSSSWHGLAS